MNKSERFDTAQARAYSMNYGAVVGIICSLSFLCAVYGLHHSGLGLLGNILGIMAFVVAGRMIRHYRRHVTQMSFGRSCWMAISIYFYAILLTGAVQYVYFAFLDNGQLARQMQEMMQMAEFRQILSQMAAGEDIDKLTKDALSIFLSPAKATMQLMWMNCILSLLLTLPTAIIGRARSEK